jgi:FkbM family methyltransferase
MQYYSQCGQDKLFKGKIKGNFLDIGAFDGILGSNTYFFEKEREWDGVCIEPNPTVFEMLKQNRTCKVINGAIYKENGIKDFCINTGYTEMLSGIVESFDMKHAQRIEREIAIHGGTTKTVPINCYKLDTILQKLNIKCTVDFCSVDTEGSELQVLESIDFTSTVIVVFAIENNFGTNEVRDFLATKGYKHIHSCGQDDIFMLESYLNVKEGDRSE